MLNNVPVVVTGAHMGNVGLEELKDALMRIFLSLYIYKVHIWILLS